MSFEQYDISTGEPSAIKTKIWNGELCEYQRTLLKQLYKTKDPKKVEEKIRELIKTTYHVDDEFRKANFYKGEFDRMSDYLESNDVLHTTVDTQTFTDEFGKEHEHEMNAKRSLTKSIPAIRALIQG